MIIFMGVPGSGKSSQGRLLADEKGLPWISTGELLRMLISGQRRKDMSSGKLFKDQEMIDLVQKIFHLINIQDEFILDGFPRTTTQADWLLGQEKQGLLKITAVVNLEITEEAVRRRLLKRSRLDDTSEAINQRFREYETAVKPVLKRFRKMGVPVYDIDGEGSVEEIQHTIQDTIKI